MEKIKNIKLPNGEVYELGGSGGLVIGQIVSINCTADYVPEGCLPCNGSEYSKAQFNDLWNNYLTTNLLNTCTYAEYEADLTTYGQCAKFAINTTNETFKVPKIKDGAVVQQAMTDAELGKAYNAGLPNITATLVDSLMSPGGSSGAISTVKSGSKHSTGTNADKYNATFDASHSNPIYGKSSTVQMNAVALRYFVVVANGQINESMMDWSAWASSINGKLNADLTNIDAIGKSFASGLGMPSNKYINLTLGASGSSYTAPANGYVILAAVVSSADGQICLKSYSSNIESRITARGGWCYTLTLPVRKGETFKLEYQQSLTQGFFTFTYAEGEV